MSSGLISQPHVAGYPGDFTVQGGAPFGFWNHTLASLHANPAHSALRRARHFELAYQRIYEEYDAFSRMTWRDDFCWQYDDALAGACDSSHAAFNAQLWSVR